MATTTARQCLKLPQGSPGETRVAVDLSLLFLHAEVLLPSDSRDGGNVDGSLLGQPGVPPGDGDIEVQVRNLTAERFSPLLARC